ncbi:sulfate transporter subunit, partial [Candidatus Poribacteria bacterium]|nr:sulfate transporter subunit [Candidatus Poribacteria bacterium]
MLSRAFSCSIGLFLLVAGTAAARPVELLNVSYDPTREFYKEYN